MTLYLDATSGPALARQLVTLAHGAGKKAILMLGGAGADQGFIAAAADARRAAFVANILSIVDEFQFDGVDLDWEPVMAADEAPLLALTQSLRTQRPNLIITIPVGYLQNLGGATVVADDNSMSYGWGRKIGAAGLGRRAMQASSFPATRRSSKEEPTSPSRYALTRAECNCSASPDVARRHHAGGWGVAPAFPVHLGIGHCRWGFFILNAMGQRLLKLSLLELVVRITVSKSRVF